MNDEAWILRRGQRAARRRFQQEPQGTIDGVKRLLLAVACRDLSHCARGVGFDLSAMAGPSSACP